MPLNQGCPTSKRLEAMLCVGHNNAATSRRASPVAPHRWVANTSADSCVLPQHCGLCCATPGGQVKEARGGKGSPETLEVGSWVLGEPRPGGSPGDNWTALIQMMLLQPLQYPGSGGRRAIAAHTHVDPPHSYCKGNLCNHMWPMSCQLLTLALSCGNEHARI